MTKHIIFAVGMALMVGMVFTGCKSDSPENQETTTAESDSTSVELDTAEAVVDTTSINKTETKETKGKKTAKTKDTMKMTPLTINVTNLKSSDATVEMSIYGVKDTFPKPGGHSKKYRVKPKDGKLELKIKDLPYGEYAVAIFQDANNDGKIDKNILGIPTEPYAFSQNFKPTLKAPSFSDCKFDYTAKKATIDIALLE